MLVLGLNDEQALPVNKEYVNGKSNKFDHALPVFGAITTFVPNPSSACVVLPGLMF